MHHVPGRCAPFGRCPWTDVVVHTPRPRCRTSGKGVRFQRSGCRTANGQGVVFGRHIHKSRDYFHNTIELPFFVRKKGPAAKRNHFATGPSIFANHFETAPFCTYSIIFCKHF